MSRITWPITVSNEFLHADSHLLTAIVAAAVGCGGGDSRDGLLSDAEGNTYVLREMLDGRTWMTDNLHLARPDWSLLRRRCIGVLRLGRLYTWASALESCRLLGTGWRLPTDDEWRQMVRRYGGVRGDSEDDGQAGTPLY